MADERSYTLRLVIEAVDKFSQKFSEVGRQVTEIGTQSQATGQSILQGIGSSALTSKITALSTAFLALNEGVGLLGGAFNSMLGPVKEGINSWSQATIFARQLELAWSAAGRSMPLEQMRAYTEELSHNSQYSEHALNATLKFFAGIKQVPDEMLPRMMKLTTDLASYSNMEVETAGRMLSRVAQGNYNALMRAAQIRIPESVRATRDLNQIFGYIEERVGNMSGVAMTEWLGKTKQIGNQWAIISRTLGEIVGTALLSTLENIRQKTQEMAEWFVKASKAGDFDGVKKVIESLGGAFITVRDAAFKALTDIGQGFKAAFGGDSKWAENLTSAIQFVANAIASVMSVIGSVASNPLVMWGVAAYTGYRILFGVLTTIVLTFTKLINLFGLGLAAITGETTAVGRLAIAWNAAAAAKARYSGTPVVAPSGGTTPGAPTPVGGGVGGAVAGTIITAGVLAWYQVLTKDIWDLAEAMGWLKQQSETTGKAINATAQDKAWEEIYKQQLSFKSAVEGPGVMKFVDELAAAKEQYKSVTGEEMPQDLQNAFSRAWKDVIANSKAALKDVGKEVIDFGKLTGDAFDEAAARGGGLEEKIKLIGQVFEDQKKRLDGYLQLLGKLGEISYEQARTEIIRTTASAEAATLRLAELDARQTANKAALAERTYQENLALLERRHEVELREIDAEIANLVKGTEEYKKASEKRLETVRKFENDRLELSQKATETIIAEITKEEQAIQKLHEAYRTLNDRLKENQEAGQKALTAVTDKSLSETGRLSSSFQQASDELRRAVDLLPTQPEKAIQLAQSARQAFQGLLQDLKALSDQMVSAEGRFKDLYIELQKEGKTPFEKWLIDIQTVKDTLKEAGTLFAQGDFKKASEVFQQAATKAAALRTAPEGVAPGSAVETARPLLDAAVAGYRKSADEQYKQALSINKDAAKEIGIATKTAQEGLQLQMQSNTEALKLHEQTLRALIEQNNALLRDKGLPQVKTPERPSPEAAQQEAATKTSQDRLEETKSTVTGSADQFAASTGKVASATESAAQRLDTANAAQYEAARARMEGRAIAVDRQTGEPKYQYAPMTSWGGYSFKKQQEQDKKTVEDYEDQQASQEALQEVQDDWKRRGQKASVADTVRRSQEAEDRIRGVSRKKITEGEAEGENLSEGKNLFDGAFGNIGEKLSDVFAGLKDSILAGASEYKSQMQSSTEPFKRSGETGPEGAIEIPDLKPVANLPASFQAVMDKFLSNATAAIPKVIRLELTTSGGGEASITAVDY